MNILMRKRRAFSMIEKHVSVLLNEAIESLNIKDGGTYVDLTLGRAGHSKEILKRIPNGKLYSFDKDEDAIKQSEEVLSKVGKNYKIIRSDFRFFRNELEKLGVSSVDGILVDLGVSSPQFDDEERGFSYRGDAILDMRMDRRQELNAKYIVNNYSFEKLLKVFKEYGEDKYSYNIAKNIVKYRQEKEIKTTQELVEIIKRSKPSSELAKKGHPAKQIFQALRIEVNDELGALKDMLDDAIETLSVGGRLCIITFHSLEDRIVKNAFTKVSKIEGSRHNVFSLPTEDDEPKYKMINNKVIIPSEEEMIENPRAKSAKMRVLERSKQ